MSLDWHTRRVLASEPVTWVTTQTIFSFVGVAGLSATTGSKFACGAGDEAKFTSKAMRTEEEAILLASHSLVLRANDGWNNRMSRRFLLRRPNRLFRLANPEENRRSSRCWFEEAASASATPPLLLADEHQRRGGQAPLDVEDVHFLALPEGNYPPGSRAHPDLPLDPSH
jgi:hypothetical protein